MQVNITGRHVEVTDPLRDYVKNKMNRVIRHCDNVTDAHCILSVQKLQHKAEATLQVSGGKLYAEAIAGDMYAAIDGLADRLDRRVKKHQEKLTDHHVREAHRQRPA